MHAEVFQEGSVETFKNYEVKLEFNVDAVPQFCKAWTTPYAMRQLMAEGTLEPVEYSDWSTPIV